MISVCMATYNGEQYINQQLKSILKQIGNTDELIISDDGSTDKTIEIIKSYMNMYSNIKLINGPHKGPINNFENALKMAIGDIIFLSDQDDVWVDGKVERVIEEFQNSETILVLHDAYIIDGKGNLISSSFFRHRNSKPGLFYNILKNSYLGCCMAFRKELLIKCIPFPSNIEMHDWWIGLMGENLGNVSFIDNRLLKYRRHENNVSSFHHHPMYKMIYNRIYFIIQLNIRLKGNRRKW